MHLKQEFLKNAIINDKYILLAENVGVFKKELFDNILEVNDVNNVLKNVENYIGYPYNTAKQITNFTPYIQEYQNHTYAYYQVADTDLYMPIQANFKWFLDTLPKKLNCEVHVRGEYANRTYTSLYFSKGDEILGVLMGVIPSNEGLKEADKFFNGQITESFKKATENFKQCVYNNIVTSFKELNEELKSFIIN